MERVKFKPKTGVKVRLEDGTGFVAEDGQALYPTAYYLRRVADGDLIEVTAKAKAGAEKGSE